MSSRFLKSSYESITSALTEMDWTRIALAVVIFLVVTLARRGIAKLSLKLIRAALRQFDIQFTRPLRDAIQPAGEMFVVASGLLAAIRIIEPSGQIDTIAEKIAVSILVASLFYGAYMCAQLSAALLQVRSAQNSLMNVGWIERILKVIAAALGVASILKIWGIDLGAMMTGLGIAGAAAALAAQDLFKNFIGGMSNMAERRFKAGDWIRAEGVVEGIVEDVALRSTAVRRFDMSLVHVPNGDLANAPLINVSEMKHRRIAMTIKLHYSTSVDQLFHITNAIKTYISRRSEFAQPPTASQYVRVDGFSDSAIDLLVYCFTLSTAYADYLEAKEGLNLEIKRAVADTGAQFARESRTFYIENAANNGQKDAPPRH